MKGHTCNPSTWRLRQDNNGFKAIMGYIVRNCLKKKKTKNKLIITTFRFNNISFKTYNNLITI
jgi:hypothetical protein